MTFLYPVYVLDQVTVQSDVVGWMNGWTERWMDGGLVGWLVGWLAVILLNS